MRAACSILRHPKGFRPPRPRRGVAAGDSVACHAHRVARARRTRCDSCTSASSSWRRVFYRRPAVHRRFGVRTEAEVEATAFGMYNQGFYNLFLAIGTLVGVIGTVRRLGAAGSDAGRLRLPVHDRRCRRARRRAAGHGASRCDAGCASGPRAGQRVGTVRPVVRRLADGVGDPSGDPWRAELHRDARTDRSRRLGNGVLPGALAGATHDEQVAVPERSTGPRRPRTAGAAGGRAAPRGSRWPRACPGSGRVRGCHRARRRCRDRRGSSTCRPSRSPRAAPGGSGPTAPLGPRRARDGGVRPRLSTSTPGGGRRRPARTSADARPATAPPRPGGRRAARSRESHPGRWSTQAPSASGRRWTPVRGARVGCSVRLSKSELCKARAMRSRYRTSRTGVR